MDFNLPADLVAYLDELDALHRARDQAARSSRTTTSASSTTAANGRAPISRTAACRATNGKNCCARRSTAPTRPATCASRCPRRYGGKDGTNLWMAVIREHLAAKGLGLHNDLQNEHSIVGNCRCVIMLDRYGTRRAEGDDRRLDHRQVRIAFGLTEPKHGSDATHMETRAVPRDPRRRRRLAHQRREDVDHRHARRHALRGVRPHHRQGRRRQRHHLLHRARRDPGREGRGVSVDLQHADRPPARQLHRRLGARRCAVRRGRPRPRAGAVFRAREPHPPGGVVAGRGASTASTRASSTPASASRSASRWPTTRRSSGRWSSLRRRPKCCGC